MEGVSTADGRSIAQVICVHNWPAGLWIFSQLSSGSRNRELSTACCLCFLSLKEARVNRELHGGPQPRREMATLWLRAGLLCLPLPGSHEDSTQLALNCCYLHSTTLDEEDLKGCGQLCALNDGNKDEGENRRPARSAMGPSRRQSLLPY